MQSTIYNLQSAVHSLQFADCRLMISHFVRKDNHRHIKPFYVT